MEIRQSELRVRVGDAVLAGELGIPFGASGLVLFAHGSGSSRASPRNQFVARILRSRGLGTMLFDLLTPQEEAIDVVTGELRFDIRLLAERVVGTIDWLKGEKATVDLPLGLYGSSTGAAAALVAAAARPKDVEAVVSRGGRPDLAGDALSLVVAPTLLIVGGEDEVVIELNLEALKRLPGEKAMEIVPGAGHLFAEGDTLEQAARLAADWFGTRLPSPLQPAEL
ncbi:MAG TPA: hydrolase [Vulgatibacter sp.]|nr:hydrolase [Vulgatibacter sp.]